MKIGCYFTSLAIIASFSLLILTNSISLKAQEEDQIWYNVVSVPPSPNSAALGKFGEVPVDKSTGIPSISVPILDLNECGIDLNISLDYHAGGIRVQDEASWVGLGWSLNAGGVITRTMRGLPDDHHNGFLETAEKVPWRSIIESELGMPVLADRTYEMVNEIAKGYLDYEPDIYYYSIGGLCGSFLFDNHGNCICFPYTGIKVEPYFSGGHIYGFTLFDPNGLVYIFGSGADYIEKTSTEVSGVDPEDYISSWYIQQIINPIINSGVLFEYDSSTIQRSVSYSHTKLFERNSFGIYGPLAGGDDETTCQTEINAKYIKRIILNNAVISFSSSLSEDGGRKLDSIIFVPIFSASRKFKFVYDYFRVHPESNTQNELRLRLLSLTEGSSNQETNLSTSSDKKYIFDYSSINLPPKNSKAVDYWGFFNGKTSNQTTLPIIKYAGQTFGDADRKPNDYTSSAATLTKITYPTGGYSEFFYENNAYSKYPSIDEISESSGTEYYNVVGIEHHTEVCNTEPLIFDTNFRYTNFVLHAEISIDTINGSYDHAHHQGKVQILSDANEILYSSIVTFENPIEIPIDDNIDLTDMCVLKVCANGSITTTSAWLTYDQYDPAELNIKREFLAGGLRIKQIINYDNISNNINYKTYEYNKSGYLNTNLPEYYTLITYRWGEFSQEWPGVLITHENQRLCIYSNPVGGLGSSSNSVSYEQVDEYFGNTLQNSGKLRTTYLKYTDGQTGGTPYFPQMSYQFMRTKPVCEEYYKHSSDDTLCLIKKIDYQYDNDTNHIFAIRGFKASRIVTIGPPVPNDSYWYQDEFAYDNYILFTYNKRLSRTSTYDINNDNQILNTKEYYYENPEHNNPTLIIENSSDGKKFKTVIKYPLDYISFTNDCRNEYENILDSCKNFYNEWSTEQTHCLSIYGECYQRFLNCLNNAEECYNRKFLFIHIGHYQYAAGYLYSKCKFYEHCTELFNADLIASGYYDCLDTNNYIACQVNANIQYNNCRINYYNSINSLYESETDPFFKGIYLLAANNCQNFMVEKTVFIDDQEIEHYKFNYTELDTTHIPVIEIAEKEIDNSGLIPEMTYKYDKHFNIIETTPFKSGTTSAYVWGYNNRYPVIFGQNVNSADLEAALNETVDSLYYLINIVGNLKTESQKSEWNHFNTTLRSNQLLKEALITTYTYSPLVGLTSKTDPNGIATYYEYDNFGRLENIRDNDSKIIANYWYNFQHDQIEAIPSALYLPYNSGSETVQITSNSQWETEEEISWLTISPSSGSYNTEISISYQANPDTAIRVGQMSAICGNATEQISIIQDGIPYLYVSPDSVFFPRNEDKIQIIVTSNSNWTAGVVERESWLQVTNLNPHSFMIECKANDSGEDREGSIYVECEGIRVNIYVKQWRV
jgi:YD repeat-containing protein